jgi:hypothetical protein
MSDGLLTLHDCFGGKASIYLVCVVGGRPMITEVRVTDAAAEVADAQDSTLTETVTSFLKSLKAKDEIKEVCSTWQYAL